MNTNPVVQSGIQAHNQQLLENAEAEVMSLIRRIEDERRSIKGHNETKVAAQKKLTELGNGGLTVEAVIGGTVTGPNADTVRSAVDRLNKGRQSQVEAQAQDLTSQVHDADGAIAACNKRIVELQEKASKVEVKAVTASEVLGS